MKPKRLRKLVQRRTPGLREDLPARVGPFGDDVPEVGGLSPFKTSSDRSTPITSEVRRLNLTISLPPRDVDGGETVERYQERVRRLGQAREVRMQSVIDSPLYSKGLPGVDLGDYQAEVLKQSMLEATRDSESSTPRVARPVDVAVIHHNARLELEVKKLADEAERMSAFTGPNARWRRDFENGPARLLASIQRTGRQDHRERIDGQARGAGRSSGEEKATVIERGLRRVRKSQRRITVDDEALPPPTQATPEATPSAAAPNRTSLSHDKELGFQLWYRIQARKHGLDPNPDAPEHKYDYRGAYKAGALPDASGHWPSEFKDLDHPNRYVIEKGVRIDTITGKPAPISKAAPAGPVDSAAHEAATSTLNSKSEPSDAQIEADNYPKGHVRIAGLEISIENPEGSKRRPEWPTLKQHYGTFEGLRVVTKSLLMYS